jgi:hypothetical protein
MASVNPIISADVRNALLNRCLTKSSLAINAASAATVKTTGPTTYTVNGIQYSKASLAAQSIAPTHDAYGNLVAAGVAAYVQPTNTTVYYLVSVNAAGTVAVSQGSYAGQAQAFVGDLSRVNIGNGLIPVEPAGYTAIGVIKVAPTSAVTFTPGTTLLDAANVNATYADVDILPASF